MKKTALFICLSVLLCAVSCSSSTENPDTGSNGTDTSIGSSDTAGAKTYDFGESLGGREIRFSNLTDRYSMHIEIDRESSSGEPLDNAMYERCRAVEEKMGITLIEEAMDDNYDQYIRTVVTAGDDTFDFMFLAAEFAFPFIAGREGLFYNLLDYPQLQLDREWWLGGINDSYTFNGENGSELYCAASAANLCGLDSMQIIYFNEDILNSYSLDMPYDLVRSGTWTMDKLLEYTTTCASLNGDDSFKFSANGSSVYGLAAHINSTIQFAYCAEEALFRMKDNTVTFTAGTERFFDVFRKIDEILDTTDGRTAWSRGNDDDPGSHIWLFENSRAAFMITELSKTNRMRDKEYEFGVLPYPKYDTAQQRYYCYNSMSFDFGIPVSCKDASVSARVGDALAYLSDEMVFDIWRDVTVESKALRNEDSIEMLGICIDNLVINPTKAFAVGKEFTASIRSGVRNGSEKIASLIAKNEDAVQASIDELYENE